MINLQVMLPYKINCNKWYSLQSDLGPISLLIILLSTNVGITQPLGSNRSFRLVMYGLVIMVDN